jgi:hypothetical protein
LALLVFHLLFMGRHPFAGRYLGQGDMPIETAIAQGRFAFSRQSSAYLMRPPPHSLELTSLPPNFVALFETAFAVPRNGTHRPSAEQWRDALSSATQAVSPCRVDKSHTHLGKPESCPWCQIEQNGGPAFFTSVSTTFTFDGTFSLDAIWLRIVKVRAIPGSNVLVFPAATAPVKAVKIPPEALWETFGGPISESPEPVYQAIPTPELPIFVPEKIPEDPVYRPTPDPVLEPFDERSWLAAADAAFRRAKSDPDYRTAKFGSIACAIIASCLVAYRPAAIAAAIVTLPFGMAWVFYIVQNVRGYRASRAEALKLRDAARSQWEARRAGIEAERARVLTLNSRRKEAVDRECARLAELRRTSPGREAQRRKDWEAEVGRVESQRDAVAIENGRRREDWLARMKTYRKQKEEAQAHNRRIQEAKDIRERERRRRKSEIDKVLHEADSMRRSWLEQSAQFTAQRAELMRTLAEAKSAYEHLRTEFESERHSLTLNQQQLQLNDHLRSALIEDARIPGVGPKRKATLAAYGIETAFQITDDAISGVPGFKSQMVGLLVDWRNEVIQSFRFDAQKVISQTELRALHMRYHSRRIALQRELSAGEERLLGISSQAEGILRQANSRLVPLSQSLAQAKADYAIV